MYPDVELNYTPQDKHGGIAVAVLDPVDFQVPEYRAERREQTKQEDDDETDLLAGADLELHENRNRDDSNGNVRDDGDDGIRGERRTSRQTSSRCQRVPRLVYRLARQNERQSASQVPENDEQDGSPDHPSICGVVRSLEQAQITDQQGDLEEADAQLVDRTAGIVASCVGDEVRGWAFLYSQSEAILGLCFTSV